MTNVQRKMKIDEKAAVTYEYIRKQTGSFKPDIGIILGTGLGGLVKDIDIKHSLDYNFIPYFPVSTVESHHGNLIFGEISGRSAVVMQGRFHFYEGYSHTEVTYPVRLMNSLGVGTLLVSNACGGLNPVYKKADLMLMRDHINFHFETPFKNSTGKGNNKRVYDEGLISLAAKAALENKISIRKGVYLSLHGPSLETRTEYRMVRKFGADVVGMSTIPEALLAVNHNMRVLGISIVTDMGFPDTLKPAVLEEILESAAEAEPKLTLLTKKIIEKL
jgi:purine-nucleoside phosphorylase